MAQSNQDWRDVVTFISGKRHVIWDWNGTLLDDVEACVASVNSILVEYELPTVDVETYREKFGFPVRDYYRSLGFPSDHETFAKVSDVFIKRFDHFRQFASLHPNQWLLLQEMAKRGIRHSVLSASDQNHLKVQLQDYGVLKHFDFTFGIQDHYAGGKIHRGRELVEQLQVDVKDLLLIGDTNHDLEVGDALGVDVLLIAHGHQSVSRLRDVHHLVLADLDLHCLLEAMSAG